jgi:hypothetical protein
MDSGLTHDYVSCVLDGLNSSDELLISTALECCAKDSILELKNLVLEQLNKSASEIVRKWAVIALTNISYTDTAEAFIEYRNNETSLLVKQEIDCSLYSFGKKSMAEICEIINFSDSVRLLSSFQHSILQYIKKQDIPILLIKMNKLEIEMSDHKSFVSQVKSFQFELRNKEES